MKKYNFFAGPAILAPEVLKIAQSSIENFDNMGLSILEISHRSKQFTAVLEEAITLTRELLDVPEEYAVLFLTGGASSQFYMAAMNLLNNDETAGYVNTGTWSKKAIFEAKSFGNIIEVASSEDTKFTSIPKNFSVDDSMKYLHITSNNTIFGTEYQTEPVISVPLVADMSSNIFSRPVDVRKYDMIYAGAQKNLGPAGTTLVIVKKDVVGRVKRAIPTMLNYQTHIAKGSMFNTPPVFPIYVSMLTMRWIKQNGGVAAMEQRNIEKADLLYTEIDRNSQFEGSTAKEDRSRMNVTFKGHNETQEGLFKAFAKDRGILGLSGHRSVGGFRASIYNAMEKGGVEQLVLAMKDFEEMHG